MGFNWLHFCIFLHRFKFFSQQKINLHCGTKHALLHLKASLVTAVVYFLTAQFFKFENVTSKYLASCNFNK